VTRGWVCHLQLLSALARAVILRSESRGIHNHILLSQIRGFPNLEGYAALFISPSNRVAQLYPQAQGFFFITSCDLQGYSEGVRIHLHMGRLMITAADPCYMASEQTKQNTQLPTVPILMQKHVYHATA
jgi:hypothetical protein